MKKILIIVIGFVLLLTGCPSATEMGKLSPPEWLVGTTWSGTLFGETLKFIFTKDDVIYNDSSLYKSATKVKQSGSEKMYQTTHTETLTGVVITYIFSKKEDDANKLVFIQKINDNEVINIDITKVE